MEMTQAEAMEVAMDDMTGDVEFPCCSSTTTSSSLPWLDDIMGEMDAWNALSPVADWGSLFPDDASQDLIKSRLCDDTGTADLNPAMYMLPDDGVHCSSNNGSTPKDDCHEKGLRLLHLLMAAAEALSGQQKCPELARVILARLKQMVSQIIDGDNTATFSNMERLATHFTDALQGLLDDRQKAATATSDVDMLMAFQMLQDMSPCIKFGHFTANQAILEAVAGERRVHVVDYDIAEGVQWASLMQAMTTSRPDVMLSPPHLRITAVVSRGGARAVQEAGRRLAAFAASIGQPFSFGQCRLGSDERFRPAMVRTLKGEALVANCVLNHAASVRRPTGSAASFLAGMATLGAKVVTVVEDEDQADTKEETSGGFVVRLMEELHRYSALWDSLEAGFPTQTRVRGLVERAILAPNIAGAVTRAYVGDGEARAGWAGEWMHSNGFTTEPLSRFNQCQARLLLGLFNDGYTMEQASPNKIVLGWKGRRMLSASVWKPLVSVASSPADGNGTFGPRGTPPLVSVPLSPMDEDGDGAFQPRATSPVSGGAMDYTEEFGYIDSFLVSSPLML